MLLLFGIYYWIIYHQIQPWFACFNLKMVGGQPKLKLGESCGNWFYKLIPNLASRLSWSPVRKPRAQLLWSVFQPIQNCAVNRLPYPLLTLFLPLVSQWLILFLISQFLTARGFWLSSSIHMLSDFNCHYSVNRIFYHSLPVHPVSCPNLLPKRKMF